nr:MULTISPECIES: tRNA (adenosine(37)-N6)-threonylcarbamoyltransferase complex dimerization subunit type 1 TsaB [unclassified Schaalia]
MCLDTSSVTSVAVVRDGQTVARARSQSARHHVETIIPMIHSVVEEAGIPSLHAGTGDCGIEAVLVGTGPAPFTGLRAGLVSARVLAYSLKVPVYGVPSLDVMARAALDLLPQNETVVAISDARRRELYWGMYRADGPDDVFCEGNIEVGSAQMLVSQLHEPSALLVCEGEVPAHSADALLGIARGPLAPIDPAVMVRIVRSRLAQGDMERVGTEPLYLRRPDIHGQAAERM